MDVTLLLRAVGAMLLAAGVLWLSCRSLPSEDSEPFGSLLGAVLVGMLAGRLAYLVGTGIDLLVARPVDLIFIRGGVAPVPAAVAALAALAWTCRSDLRRRLDLLAPAAVAGLAAWEAGCWWQGSCLGTRSDLWWALALPGSELTRHPVGLYAGLLLAAGAFWLLRRPIRWKGATAAAGLGWASFVRLAVPLWSVGGWSSWTWWYLAGLLVGLGGLAAANSTRGRTESSSSPTG